MVGRALIRRLVAAGTRVLATARSRPAAAAVVEAGAEPLHTDIANLEAWAAEAAPAEVVFHVGLPRIDPPLRHLAARRRAGAAARDAGTLARVAGDRPVVVASHGLVYGDRPGPPAVDDEPASGAGALARAARAAEDALAGSQTRVVRLPWVYGPGGLARDLIVGLRTRRYRVIGAGANRWALLSDEDAAAALVAAAAAPPGVYTAAEEDIPTQLEVVDAICAVPGHRRPDHAPPALAGIAMGGALTTALASSLAIRSGRLLDHGWAPAAAWRRDLVSLAEGPLPLRR